MWICYDGNMQDRFKAGARLFNSRAYWEAHEAWEADWRTAEGQERKYLSALILLAAALHKRWMHENVKHRNFDKALRYLNDLPCHYDGVNLNALKNSVWEALSDPEVTPMLPLD